MEGIKAKMMAIKNERDDAVERAETLENQLKSVGSRVDEVSLLRNFTGFEGKDSD